MTPALRHRGLLWRSVVRDGRRVFVGTRRRWHYTGGAS